MAEFPCLPLWTDAYISDTQHLSNEEHGVYLRLLMFAWRSPDCSLPLDDKRLALMVGVTAGKWAKLKPAIMTFWDVDGDVLRQKKLTKERAYAVKSREQKRAAGKASAEAKARKTKETPPTDVPASVPTESATDGQQPIPIPIPTVSSSSNEELVNSAIEVWNETATQVGWSQVQKINKPRVSAILARLKECDGMDGWQHAINRAAASRFLTGQTSRPFFASFDWLTKPANFTKLMEGNYDNRTRPNSRASHGSRSTGHDSLMAGFAQSAHSEPRAGGSDFDGGETAFSADDPAMGGWPDCNPSQPLLRVIGSE